MVVFFLSLLAPAVFAAKPENIFHTAAQNFFVENQQKIEDFQQLYLVEHGEYWQALDSFVGGVPQDAPEAATWDTLGVQKSEMAGFSTSVDVYVAPCGKGYVYNSFVRETEGMYVKSVNFGCETYRGHDWIFVPYEQP